MTAYQDFPFNEAAHFDTKEAAMSSGYDENQIWSVVECGVVDDVGNEVFTYGPSHHWVNVIHYVATEERHDGDTYYEELWERDD
jgi:hypothetical protein